MENIFFYIFTDSFYFGDIFNKRLDFVSTLDVIYKVLIYIA